MKLRFGTKYLEKENITKYIKKMNGLGRGLGRRAGAYSWNVPEPVHLFTKVNPVGLTVTAGSRSWLCFAQFWELYSGFYG